MSDPTRGALRQVRSAVLAVVVLALAATAHVLAGGELPTLLVLSGLALGTACATWALTRFRLGRVAILAVLGAGQFLLHQAFELFGPSSAVATTGHDHSAAAMAAQLSSATPMTGMTDSLPMVTAHVLATILAALVVAHGERALWALLAWCTPLARVLRLVLPPVTPRPARRVETTARRPRRLDLVRVTPRRGPPPVLQRA